MTSVKWYNVGNKEEFLNKDIPQEVKTIDLEDLGEKEVVFINGINFSVIFNGRMMTPDLNGRNPFDAVDNTCYVDNLTGEVWVGYAVEL